MARARTFRRYPSAQAAAQDMASESCAFLRERIEATGQASVVLTGGSSPKALYTCWGNEHGDSLDWSQVHFFWGDERNVPHGTEESNVTTASPLLDHLPVDKEKLHVWRTDLDPSDALAHMRQVLRDTACSGSDCGFDLTLLGVGPDGHIASLFPEDQPWLALSEEAPDDVKFISDSPKPPPERYTFTLPCLNRSSLIYLTPFGENKAEAVRRLEEGDPRLPVSHVQGRNATIVWTDQGV